MAAAILLLNCCTWAQDGVARSEPPAGTSAKSSPVNSLPAPPAGDPKRDVEMAARPLDNSRSFSTPDRLPELPRRFGRTLDTDTAPVESPTPVSKSPGTDGFGDTDLKPPTDDSAPFIKEKFHWRPALEQSMVFLAFQHAFRMTQPKTTKELGGPFFKDWFQSIKNMRGWRDGDNAFTNYVAHPLQGSITGRIFVNNSDRARKQEFGPSREYWNSRVKAMLWSAFWSTQFELGPLSEASLGNVGLKYKGGYCTMAHVDLVVTPVVGTGVMIAEDAIDKYVLKNWLERGDSSTVKIKILRSFLTPTMSVTNLLRGKMPWKRDERPL